MGRKKRDDVKLKPFCYYCDKEFNSEAILHKHQRTRHFSCCQCRKKFNTAKSLANHLMSRHRITLETVANAKKGRESVLLEIYIMSGIPEEIIDEKIHQKTIQKEQKLDQELKKLGIDVDAPDFEISKFEVPNPRPPKTKNFDPPAIMDD